MSYKKWKIIAFVVAILLIGVIVFKMTEQKSGLTINDLHEKSGAECIEILEAYGLELAPAYQNDQKLAEESVKTIIDDIYINGLQFDRFAYSYTEMNDLAKQIVRILKEHIEEVYEQPVLKLSADYTVGKFIHKDGKQYYIEDNKLAECDLQTYSFVATTKENYEEKEFSFEWYCWKDEIRIASDNASDTYYFEPIKGCASHVLLATRVPDTEFWTYKLCNLENQTIEPLFDGKLDGYSVDWIELSSDLAEATVSINKGEKLVVFDGMTMSPVEQEIKENPYKDKYVWTAALEEKILVATEDGVLKLLDFASGDVISKVDTGLDFTYSTTEENYSISLVESDNGIYVAIYKFGREIAIYKL